MVLYFCSLILMYGTIENILQDYNTLRTIYNRSAVSFKIFNANSFAEIAMTFRVRPEFTDTV